MEDSRDGFLRKGLVTFGALDGLLFGLLAFGVLQRSWATLYNAESPLDPNVVIGVLYPAVAGVEVGATGGAGAAGQLVMSSAVPLWPSGPALQRSYPVGLCTPGARYKYGFPQASRNALVSGFTYGPSHLAASAPSAGRVVNSCKDAG